MNIIFDLCGVIVKWQPDQIINRFFNEDKIKELVQSHILFHSDWKELDKGTLERSNAIKRASSRTGLSIEIIDKMVDYIPKSLLPIQDTINLMHSLKIRGHNLFLLTNIPIFSIEYLEKEYSFFNLFNGSVVSCRINTIKPELEIFNYLINKYNLSINESVFIDDTEINANVASSLGIYSIKFENAFQCAKELKNIKVL